MHKQQVIDQLTRLYPSKNIVSLPEDNPTEIICEVEPTVEHPEYSKAVVVYDRSVPHYHVKTVETYTVLKGTAQVIIDGKVHELKQGDTCTIPVGSVHYCLGDEVWMECYSQPGWTAADHIVAKNKLTK